MKLLVTGSSGFIGKAVISDLTASGHEVIGVDRKSPSQLSGWTMNQEINRDASADFIKANLGELKNRQLPSGIDWCIHLAGQSSAEKSMKKPRIEFRNNLAATAALTSLSKLENSGFTFASSMAVYGDTSKDQVSEQTDPKPSSLYGWSKLYGEKYLESLAHLKDRHAILRFFNVYGPGQDLLRLDQGMVSVYLSMLRARGTVQVKGSLDRVRDFIFISDAVEAVRASVSNPVEGPVNIASGNSTSVRELLELISKHSGLDFQVEELPGTLGDVFGFSGNNAKAGSSLGWIPRTGLSGGIKQTWENLDV